MEDSARSKTGSGSSRKAVGAVAEGTWHARHAAVGAVHRLGGVPLQVAACAAARPRYCQSPFLTKRSPFCDDCPSCGDRCIGKL